MSIRLLIALLFAAGVTAANDPLATQRQEFVQAYTALQHDQSAAADSPALQAYVLYPYLQAARLSHEVQHLSAGEDVRTLDQRIAMFLDSHSAPASHELRHTWLLDLASRKQWPQFFNYYHDDNDAELRCQHVNGLLATQHESEAATEVAPIWLTAERLSMTCNPSFQWAQENHVITPALLEQRIRLALKAGNYQLARDLIDPLPALQAAPLHQWIALIEQPQAAIDSLIAHPDIKVEAPALQDCWMRLARKDPDAAIVSLPKLITARGLSDADASPYILNLALALAWNRRNEALEYFAQVAPRDMTEQAYEWQARAALWRGDWSQVVKSIAIMPATLKTSVRWRYWSARATERISGIAAAHASYEQLVNSEDNYFAALAAARLHKPYVPHPQRFVADSAIVKKLAANPDLLRVRELVAVQLINQATSEWNTIYSAFNAAEQLAAIDVTHEWAWYDQAILLAAKLGQFNDYKFLYPRPYNAEVKAAAKLSGLSADFIYGQLRQESLYRRDAKSGAGALGLMQLIPASARMTARQLKQPKPGDDDLFNPAINVPLGAVNLKQMIDAFGGQTIVGLAAYNAGPTAARRWLAEKAIDSDVWIENIPFNETRVYVIRVLWHSLIFNWLRTGRPVNTQAWLTPVHS